MLSHQIPDQKNADILETICDLCIKNKLGPKNHLKPSVQKEFQTEVQLKNQKEASPLPQSFLVSKKNDFEKNSSKEKNSEEKNTETKNSEKTKNSRYIPANSKRIIFSRAEGKCEYVHPVTGVRCNSTYQLEFDHIQPMAFGGKTELSNLRICCRICNTYAAWSMGIGFETTSYFSMNEES